MILTAILPSGRIDFILEVTFFRYCFCKKMLYLCVSFGMCILKLTHKWKMIMYIGEYRISLAD